MNSQFGINDIISKYNKAIKTSNGSDGKKGEDIEFEIGVSFDNSGNSPIFLKQIYSYMFAEYKKVCTSVSIIEHLDIYYDNDIRKTIVFSNGINQKKDIILKKYRLSKPFFIKRNIKNVKDIKAKLSMEKKEKESSIIGNVQFMKFKLRLRFDIGKRWTVELDLIKNVKPESNLKSIKDLVFKEYAESNLLNSIEFSLFDECRVEFEFSNIGDLSLENIFDPVNDLSTKLNSDISLYQKYIFSLARQIITTNKNYLESFRVKSGLKKLLNNVIEIDANVYYKQVQPKLSEGGFFVTDKIDGKRSILMIKTTPTDGDSLKSNIIILNNEINIIKEKRFSKIESASLEHTSLDCELLLINGVYKLFVFDVITYKGERLSSKPFMERFKVMQEAVDYANQIIKINDINSVECRMKDFVHLNENWVDDIKTFYNKKRDYEIDGLIFTPNDDKDYSSMIGFKWKPAEHSTIDFYIKKVSDNVLNTSPDLFNFTKKEKESKEINKYVLFSGINRRDLNKFNMSLLPNYELIAGIKFNSKESVNYNNLIPIQFSTSDNPKNYVFSSTNSEIDGKIGEFGWDNSSKKWVLKRIRTDRDVELERGEYYGNYYKVAESIWYSINNPLLFDDLFSKDKGYFTEDNVDTYREQRHFNSFVKTQVIDKCISLLENEYNKPLVIDLAAGKGQDMPRLVNLGINNAIFVDNDKNALQELIKRKHGLNIRDKKMKITTCTIDLKDPYKENIKKIEESYGESLKEKAGLIMCNFAIHYFTDSADNVKNIINTVNYLLKNNGLFIFTSFDGKKVKELCGDLGWDSRENSIGNLKYSIKPLYANTEEFANYGQKVKLILPFSKGEYYEENLVNLAWISEIMRDNGFNKETVGSFSNLFGSYKNIENLTDDDKIFSGLYSYAVFRKTTSSIIVSKNNILTKYLPNDTVAEIVGAKEDLEYINVLGNVPLSNIILIDNSKDKLVSLEIEEVKKAFHAYGYRDSNENKRLKKKIFIILDKNTNIEKYLNKQVSLIRMEREFVGELNNYIQWVCKIPVVDIIVKNKCRVSTLHSMHESADTNDSMDNSVTIHL
jgi:mRNA capping enzyme/mRNA capping enzyme, catalytic domain/mRNA capping enzyme, C-terminal domain